MSNWEIEKVNCSHEALVEQVDELTNRIKELERLVEIMIVNFGQIPLEVPYKLEELGPAVYRLEEENLY